MAYVPEDTKWFVADLVEEIRVEGHRRNIVHINTVLIRATTPEEAYARAVERGKASNQSYTNSKGETVSIRFRGLRHLDVIFDALEDGCEISFREKLGVSEAAIEKLILPKEELEAFLPIRDRPGRPDYSSGEVMAELLREFTTPPPEA
ncbi:MAG: DUF4288 domain-containing protein [Armatimonadetes bacterium]|nr:DUF4288 domain-containing protein [Akkermansiaceae bacterium]